MTKKAKKTPLTAQDIFDTSARHILKQRRASVAKVNGGSSCRYRGPNGTACAVGALLTNEEARGLDDDVIGGSGVLAIVDRLPKKLRIHAELLHALQYAHDGAATDEWDKIRSDAVFMRIWPERVRAVAEKFGLSTAVLDEAST